MLRPPVSLTWPESLLPAAPKGAPTSYGLFVKDRYTSDRSSYITPETSGKAGITAASSKIAQEWNDLSSTLKDEYAAKAKGLKRTYDAEYRKWYESLDKDTIKAYEKASGKKVAQPGGRAANKKALDAKAKESGQPPRPLTAFFEYLETFRSGEGKGLGVVELAKKAGEEWKAMVDEEKQVSYHSYWPCMESVQIARPSRGAYRRIWWVRRVQTVVRGCKLTMVEVQRYCRR